MQARAFDVTMLLFHPVLLEPVSVRQLILAKATNDHFWLVDAGADNLRFGRRVEDAELIQRVAAFQ